MTALAWTLVAILAVCVALLLGRRRRDQPARPPSRDEAPAEHLDPGADRFDRVPAIALVVDDAARVVAVNRVARERFGFLRVDMTLLEAFSQHLLVGPVREALAEQRAATFPVRLFAEGPRRFLVSVVPYERADGRREAIILLDDQTELTSYQELRSQFVANVSHELRTPLTGLSALLETLTDPDLDPELGARFLGRARRETSRLSALIADTLLLSELEATQGSALDARVDLGMVAEEVRSELAERAAQAGVALRAEAGDGCHVGLTERLGHTLVANLVENAVRYAGAGSEAVLRVARSGRRVELSVTDDGAGIDQEHLPHIFERFYRVDPSRSKELGGTGLGLSIVKHIAEHCGGRAEAESRAGRGTTIRVTLPLVDDPAPPGPDGP